MMHRQKSGAHTHERNECISAPDEGAVTLALAESEAETGGLLLTVKAFAERVADVLSRLIHLPQRVAGEGRRPVGSAMMSLTMFGSPAPSGLVEEPPSPTLTETLPPTCEERERNVS